MTKGDIIKDVAKALGVHPEDVRPIVDETFGMLKSTLKNGITVEISGFGKFIIHQKAARMGRNPMTGEEAEVSSRKVVTFKPSKLFREAVGK